MTIYSLSSYAKTNIAFMARHRNINALSITQSNLLSIAVKVVANGVTTTLDTMLSIPSTVFDTLQTGNGWPLSCNDGTSEVGYNFRWVAPKAAFPTRGWYRVEFIFTDTSDQATKIVFEGPILSSSE